MLARSEDEMVQDTRKDPRAKVLTMTVRYKSASIDDFIEHHSHDVSRGGIFIKTPSPFPAGTLLKFEIKIAEDKAIIGGVGRVVWKREPPQSSDARPAGMGVKFLKIDEASRKLIDLIVDKKGDAPSAFDESVGSPPEASIPPPPPKPETPEPEAPPAPAEQPAPKKVTMLGLGSMELPPEAKLPEEKKEESTFFPKSESDADDPPAEEPTVMKQAAQLLAEALKGAGGSMDEIGVAPDESDRGDDKDKAKDAKPADAASEEKQEETGKSDDDVKSDDSKSETDDSETKPETKPETADKDGDEDDEDDEKDGEEKEEKAPPPKPARKKKPESAAAQFMKDDKKDEAGSSMG
ncbi:MAG: TIGR02266 family protein, partial [Polyangiaceae bacterium]|nr:TIGR02266 family protein [Polyangiaceae bacterium]